VLINNNVPQQSRNYRQLGKDQICFKQDQEQMSISSLLSLLPLSCIVVPIETAYPRGYSAFPSLNSSRGTSANSTAYSIDYADCIQAQAKNLTCAEQVENGEIQSLSLSYAPIKNVMLDCKGTGSSELICQDQRKWTYVICKSTCPETTSPR